MMRAPRLSIVTFVMCAAAVLSTSANAFGATPTPAPLACCGDANGDGVVTEQEVLSCISILHLEPPFTPSPCDCDQDGVLTTNDIIRAVNNVVGGCPGAERPTPSVTATPTAGSDGAVFCGNGNVEIEAGEECDDGGTCIGGSNAGAHCTSEAECIGSGVCIGGAKFETVCDSDTDCPDGVCRRCVPFGGDGCAANCTIETDIPLHLALTTLIHTELYGGIYFPAEAVQGVIAGKAINSDMPVVIKATPGGFGRIPIGGSGCGCVRTIAKKTCGGTIFERDRSPSTDCTPGYTAGDTLCNGLKPCTFVHGDGNSASGTVGCDTLVGANSGWTQNGRGTSRPPDCSLPPFLGVPRCAEPPVVSLSGTRGPGAAVLFNTQAISFFVGWDCCNDAEPFDARGTPVTAPLVTGTATAEMFNINGQDGTNLGPFALTGTPFNCSAMGSGATLASAYTEANWLTAGDVVVTGVFELSATGLTPTPTPTPLAPVCVGDCNGDRQVRVNEIVTGVDIALGVVPPDTCPSLQCLVGVACIVQAVNNALYGCPTPRPTPTPPSGNCRDSNDCTSAVSLCLVPGGFAGCGPTPTGVPTSIACNTDSDCAAHGDTFVCEPVDPRTCLVGNACVPGCTSNSDCSADQACSATHHCVPRSCATDAGCPQFFTCGSQQCFRSGCSDDFYCDGGFCVTGSCYSELGTCVAIPE